MKIIVVGAGYVGLVAACCLAKSGHDVICVETNPDKLKMLDAGKLPILEKGLDELLDNSLSGWRLSFRDLLPELAGTDVVVIAVGTPSLASGATDLSQVHRVAAAISEAVRERITLVMKSTVPPGTGLKLVRRHFSESPVDYVSNPEFLREGQAVFDWYWPSRIVIGAERPEAAEVVRAMYSDVKAPAVVTDITSAETIKYAANAFLATKISFINEIANMCEAMGADIDDVTEGISLDPRIGPDFLHAGLGYGGSCFPKDARALNFSALSNGYDLRLLKSTIEVNAKQSVMAVRKMGRLLNGLEGKEIALLGLSFKAETDDVRESPALSIAALLCEGEARLRVYDPAAMENARPFLPADVVMAPDIYRAVDGAQAVFIATDWAEFITADWERIRKSMTPPYLILDGRNALPRSEVKSLGFQYAGIGRQ